ncbi:transcriptional regulator [Actinoplanes sp. SE50]|uniref:winged helix-turn-helix transcriptional regulator n=1 Tax=unclassified Actinoplanes TaxID=2626549 RepID=UPI00023EBC41|nr:MULTISPECIES: helix-turn-helix domain-containing protein [unclassified Actinoplanes]AEV87404.1 putative HTH-type transcriptional regulator [Actinoplanes sp. SE50/110]ATO85806.1 transcriptional regulator [Actinoplanes sp. SE50]SLM03219.1 HxlR family transcriptional regulator [Actinoplanes sp. SE50/110]
MVSHVTPPEALDWDVDNCTISRAMEILGEKWTMLVLREIFSGIRRFDDMRVRTRIPRQVLANRLTALVAAGVLRREPYQEPGARVRHEYRLTEKGFDLYPVLIALAGWGNRYLADPAGPPIQFVHRECAAEVDVAIRCADGHDVTDHRDVLPRPGPGARRRG